MTTNGLRKLLILCFNHIVGSADTRLDTTVDPPHMARKERILASPAIFAQVADICALKILVQNLHGLWWAAGLDGLESFRCVACRYEWKSRQISEEFTNAFAVLTAVETEIVLI